MKLKEFMSIETLIGNHTAKLNKLAERDINDLSISDLAFIKMVSAGSITSQRRYNFTNEEILCKEQRRTIEGNAMRVKSYLRNLPLDELRALLNGLELER